MPEHNLVENGDEIDVRELFLVLWRGKYVIFLISVMALVLASIYLRSAVRTYSVQAVFKPVLETSGGPNLNRFSGLASLAGVSVPTSNSSDFITYQKLLFSEEVAERVFTNRDLIKKLFQGEWNTNSGSFEAPLLDNIDEWKQLVKSTLTGMEKKKYIPPNPKRLSMLAAGMLTISVDGSTGFFSINSQTSSPEIVVELILNVSQETENLLKERFLSSAEETLEFYHQKLLTSRSPEHREALAKLISEEDKKLMLASKSSNFVAEALTRPTVSLYPTSPRSSSVLAIGFFVGVLGGVVLSLLKYFLTEPRDS